MMYQTNVTLYEWLINQAHRIDYANLTMYTCWQTTRYIANATIAYILSMRYVWECISIPGIWTGLKLSIKCQNLHGKLMIFLLLRYFNQMEMTYHLLEHTGLGIAQIYGFNFRVSKYRFAWKFLWDLHSYFFLRWTVWTHDDSPVEWLIQDARLKAASWVQYQ